jgi:plastocyanin
MRIPAIVGALVLLVAVGSGCGGSDNGSASSTSTTSTQPAGGGQTLKLTADPSGALKFNTRHLSAKAGRVTIQLSNPSSVQHAIAILGNGVAETGATVGSGGVSRVTANLPAGRYDFYCPVDAHKQAGMSGLLVVK